MYDECKGEEYDNAPAYIGDQEKLDGAEKIELDLILNEEVRNHLENIV